MKYTLRKIRRGAAKAIGRWMDRKKAIAYLHSSSMDVIHQRNSQTLSRVNQWITDDVWLGGVFQYGLPKEVRNLIDKSVGDDHTYTDAMLSLVTRLRKPVRYIEIGVSVGKNFLQMSRYLQSASLLGFDIEEINPTLKANFEFIGRREFATMPGSLKTTPSSITSLQQRDSLNVVEYLCGDVFDRGAWAQLTGRKFNLLFSDAFHTPEALNTEFETLMEYDLLDEDEVIIMWDDLHYNMEPAFRDICRKLERARPTCKNTSFLVPLRGWLGENEAHHPVGFFLSIRK